jgi:hypothetical protein
MCRQTAVKQPLEGIGDKNKEHNGHQIIPHFAAYYCIPTYQVTFARVILDDKFQEN